MRLPNVAAWFLDPDIRGQRTTEPSWPVAVALAERQFGVVARAQLLARDVPEKLIDRWVEGKRLHVWHRGVYAVGHRALSGHGRRIAAVLACGEDAALWSVTAAAHQGMRPSAAADLHVWVPGQQGRKLRGIRPHRDRDILPEDFEVVEGIRTATPMRVLVDLAPLLTVRQLRAAVDQTEHLRRFDLTTLHAIIARRPRRPGIAKLREVLELYEGPMPTLTELEERGLGLIERAGLPRALVQHDTAIGLVDFFWPDRGFILEMDGFRWHKSRHRFELDRARDAEHLARGIVTMRVTWHQAVEPASADRLRRAYRNRGSLTPDSGVKEPRYLRKPS